MAGFPLQLIKALVCQNDGKKLNLLNDEKNEDGNIMNGVLKCSQCREEYSIKDGVVFMLKRKEDLPEELAKEIDSRDLQAGKYDERLRARYYKEIIPTLKRLGDVKNKTIIEYGCGTGRFTEELIKKEAVDLAIDFSLESLKILQNKINSTRLGLVLADSTMIKTKIDFFDLAVSTQFYEHIPTQQLKDNYLQNAKNTLKNEGVFLNSVYHFDWRRRLKNISQTGQHSGGIFYHYFTRKEIKKEIGKYFAINNLDLIDITLPGEVRLHLPLKIGGWLSSLASKLFFVNKLGHLILVKAIKEDGASYFYPTLFFKKKWFWFSDPIDIRGVDMVNFFSYNNVQVQGFKKKAGETVVINLLDDVNMIWERMRKNFIRKQIIRGEKNGIKIIQDNNFQEFKKTYIEFRKDKSIAKDKYEVFEKNGILFSAYYKGKMIAGGIFIAKKPYIRAWVLASSRYGSKSGKMRDIVGQANRLLIWEVIKYAKNNGFEKFDLGGINTQSQNKQEKSLAEFKMAFGGEIIRCYYYRKIYSKVLKFLVKIKARLQ